MSKTMDEIREEAADFKAQEIAARLLEKNLSVEEIAKYCSLSVEIVNVLKLNKNIR